jgi:hypothetical protein
VLLDSNPDPSCGAKVDTPEERNDVYSDRSFYPGCIEPGGRLRGERVGKARLERTRAWVRSRLGPPQTHHHGIDRWCVIGKGELRVAYAHGTAAAIVTSSRGHSINGVSRGDSAKRAHRRLALGKVLDVAGYRVYTVSGSGPALRVLGIKAGRVRWAMIVDWSSLISKRTLGRLARHIR